MTNESGTRHLSVKSTNLQSCAAELSSGVGLKPAGTFLQFVTRSTFRWGVPFCGPSVSGFPWLRVYRCAEAQGTRQTSKAVHREN